MRFTAENIRAGINDFIDIAATAKADAELSIAMNSDRNLRLKHYIVLGIPCDISDAQMVTHLRSITAEASEIPVKPEYFGGFNKFVTDRLIDQERRAGFDHGDRTMEISWDDLQSLAAEPYARFIKDRLQQAQDQRRFAQRTSGGRRNYMQWLTSLRRPLAN